jgi:hypothetical protein
MSEFIIGIIAIYIFMSTMIVGGVIDETYNQYKTESYFKILICIFNDIITIGDLLLFILLFGGWVLVLVGVLIFELLKLVFCNKYFKKVLNIKIR